MSFWKGFERGFSPGLQAGIQGAMHQQEVALRQRQMKMQEQRQAFARFDQDLARLDAIDDPELYGVALNKTIDQYKGALGGLFLSDDFVKIYKKGTTEARAQLRAAVGAVAAKTGWEPRVLIEMEKKNPSQFYGIIADHQRQERDTAANQAALQFMQQPSASPAGAPMGTPQAGNRVAALQAEVDRLSLSPYATTPAVEGRIKALQNQISVEMKQLEQARQSQQFGASHGLAQQQFAWQQSEGKFHRDMAIAQQRADISAQARPLPPGLLNDLSGLQSQIASLDQIELLYAGSAEASGKIAGRVGAVKDFFGVNTPEESRMRAAVETYKNMIAHEQYGAALTANEIKRLEAQVPNLTDSPSVFKAKMVEARDTLRKAHERQIRNLQDAGYHNIPGLPQGQRQPPVTQSPTGPSPVGPGAPPPMPLQGGAPQGLPRQPQPMSSIAPQGPQAPQMQAPPVTGRTLGEMYGQPQQLPPVNVTATRLPSEGAAAAIPDLVGEVMKSVPVPRPMSQATPVERKMGKLYEQMSPEERASLSEGQLKEVRRKEELCRKQHPVKKSPGVTERVQELESIILGR